MTLQEAYNLVGKYFFNGEHEEDEAAGVEALKLLIELDKDLSSKYISLLGGYYYGKKNYNLALKYYEIAADKGVVDALLGLGYIWYYGRTGEKDYEKAFNYFSKAAESGDCIAEYKLADMYKNGYFVRKNTGKYKMIIEKLYKKLKDLNPWQYPVGDIQSRLARIRKEEGKDAEALTLLIDAEKTIQYRLRENHFWGDLNVMKWLKEDHYKWTKFRYKDFSLYDLYYLLKSPVKVEFRYHNAIETVEAVTEDDETVISFNGKWYRTIDDFFNTAEIMGEKLTRIVDDLTDFKVL